MRWRIWQRYKDTVYRFFIIIGLFGLAVSASITIAAKAEVADDVALCDPSRSECKPPATVPVPGEENEEEEDTPEAWRYQSATDYDDDGTVDRVDNCPFVANPAQSDSDAQGEGGEGDGIGDACDNCPSKHDRTQSDLDGDGIGDACDNDDDGDAVLDDLDNCPMVYNPDQADLDADGMMPEAKDAGVDAGSALDGGANGGGVPTSDAGVGDAAASGAEDAGAVADAGGLEMPVETLLKGGGDACDEDIDGDGVHNFIDPCPYGDMASGDVCHRDSDGDGVLDFQPSGAGNAPLDNCPTIGNPDQADQDGDGVGDLCDPDLDGDGVVNSQDNCLGCVEPSTDKPRLCSLYEDTVNPNQGDIDRDGLGDACDETFCFRVPVLADCLDPEAPFEVATPNLLNSRTGDPILLRLFANRENAGLTYRWRLQFTPKSSKAKIENPAGATGYSSPFEYHYLEGAEPVLTCDVPGRYGVEVTVQKLYDDGEFEGPVVTARAEALVEVRGTNLNPPKGCGCSAVGAAQPGGLLMAFLFSILLALLVRFKIRS
jgi:hypothetical protein